MPLSCQHRPKVGTIPVGMNHVGSNPSGIIPVGTIFVSWTPTEIIPTEIIPPGFDPTGFIPTGIVPTFGQCRPKRDGVDDGDPESMIAMWLKGSLYQESYIIKGSVLVNLKIKMCYRHLF